LISKASNFNVLGQVEGLANPALYVRINGLHHHANCTTQDRFQAIQSVRNHGHEKLATACQQNQYPCFYGIVPVTLVQ